MRNGQDQRCAGRRGGVSSGRSVGAMRICKDDLLTHSRLYLYAVHEEASGEGMYTFGEIKTPSSCFLQKQTKTGVGDWTKHYQGAPAAYSLSFSPDESMIYYMLKATNSLVFVILASENGRVIEAQEHSGPYV